MRKLPRGMSKKRGRYYLRDRRGGKDKWLALGGDYSEAKRRYRELKNARQGPTVPETVASFSRQWLAEYIATKRVGSGYNLASQRLRDHILPVIGHKYLTQVTTADLRGLRAVLDRKASLSPGSVKHVLADVRCLFRYAVDEAELLDRSPFRASLMPTIQEGQPKGLSDIEVARILTAVPAQYELLVRLALETGLRFGELRGLRWEDVVFGSRPHLVVRRSHDGPTKSRKIRKVPLTAEAENLLLEAPRASAWVFTGRSRGMIAHHAGDLNRTLKEVVSDFHFHRLRHTFSCRFLENGGSLEVLQSVLGHSSIRLTERYGRISDEAVWHGVRNVKGEAEKTVDKTGTADL